MRARHLQEMPRVWIVHATSVEIERPPYHTTSPLTMWYLYPAPVLQQSISSEGSWWPQPKQGSTPWGRQWAQHTWVQKFPPPTHQPSGRQTFDPTGTCSCLWMVHSLPLPFRLLAQSSRCSMPRQHLFVFIPWLWSWLLALVDRNSV